MDIELIEKWEAFVASGEDSDSSNWRFNTLLMEEPEGLKRILRPLKHGEELTRRYLQRWDAGIRLQSGYRAGQEELEGHLRAHIAEVKEFLDEMDEPDVIESIPSTIRKATLKEISEVLHDDESPEGWIYDVSCDYLKGCASNAPWFRELREATWLLTNNLFMSTYLLWPLYDTDDRVTWLPYFHFKAAGGVSVVANDAILYAETGPIERVYR